MKIKYYLSLCFLLVLSQSFAQLADFPLSPLEPSDFENNSWQQVGDVSIHPFNNEISVQQGTTVWMSSKNDAVLATKHSLGEMKFSFHLMQSDPAKALLVLQNDYVISFSKNIEEAMGTIVLPTGQIIKPKVKAAKAAGLWNEVELIFKPSENGKPAILESLEINGLNIHTNVFLPAIDNTNTQVSFVNVKGTTALKAIETLSFEVKKPLKLRNLTYSVKENSDWNIVYDKAGEGIVSGSIEKLTHELPHDYQQYQTLYEGDLIVEEDGHYAFTLDFTGRAKLFINDEEIVGSEGFFRRSPQTGKKKLSKGTYKLQYVYQKAWRPAEVGLYLSGSTFRPYSVHASRSLPVAVQEGGIYVQAKGSKPKLIRGFMMHKGEKRTEVVSVGDTKGVHYSLDLEKGSLLHAWRGDFADVTEMWFNRGEPQLLQPLGLSTELGGSIMAFDAYMSDLVYDKYILNTNGEPTFHFTLGEASLSKHIQVSEEGLDVSVGIDSPTAVSLVLAEGNQITDLGNGNYKVDETYFKTSGGNIQILEMDKKQLVFQGDKETKKLNYKIIW